MPDTFKHFAMPEEVAARAHELEKDGMVIEEFDDIFGLGFPALAVTQHGQVLVLVKLMPDADPVATVSALMDAFEISKTISANTINAPTTGRPN